MEAALRDKDLAREKKGSRLYNNAAVKVIKQKTLQMSWDEEEGNGET